MRMTKKKYKIQKFGWRKKGFRSTASSYEYFVSIRINTQGKFMAKIRGKNMRSISFVVGGFKWFLDPNIEKYKDIVIERTIEYFKLLEKRLIDIINEKKQDYYWDKDLKIARKIHKPEEKKENKRYSMEYSLMVVLPGGSYDHGDFRPVLVEAENPDAAISLLKKAIKSKFKIRVRGIKEIKNET